MEKLDAFTLKWIAIITMAVDHTGAILFPDMLIFRYIGRLAFPVFCFLLVEGFLHTRNALKYMERLLVFALASEVPYDLAFGGTILEFQHQNVGFTLLLGIGLLYVLSRTSNKAERVLEILLVMWAAAVLHTDYSYKGVLLIAVFYLLRNERTAKLFFGALWNLLGKSQLQMFGAFAMIPIGMYNGERGRTMKYFFYLFYPLHLLILYGMNRWIM